MEPLVLGLFLKVETRGWTGPAPKLPKDPVRVETGQDALQTFIYDLTPKEEGLAVSDACQRIASRIERLFSPERTPFPEGHYALRLKLEVGLLGEPTKGAISYTWPLDFVMALADAGIELSVSHYIPSAGEDDDDDDEDY